MADTTFDDLTSAVEDAVSKVEIPKDALHEELMGQEKKEEKKEPEKKEVEEKEPETSEIDADEEEVKKALVFFRALSDPKQSQELAEVIARNAGFELTKKSEVKAVIRDAKSILKEKLGDNYDLLSGDALAEAVKEIVKDLVDTQVTEKTKPVLDKISVAEKAENERKATSAMQDFFKRHDITDEKTQDEIAGKMLSKFKTMPATPEASVDTYLDDIYFLVNREASANKAVKETVKKIKKNAEERNSSGEGIGNDDRIKRGSAMPSLDEAVRAAYKGIRLDD